MTGHWMGTIEDDRMSLRVVLHIDDAEGTLDNLDIGRTGIAVTVVAFRPDLVRLDVWPIGASYEGRMAGDRIEGTWRMGEDASRLVLNRVQPSPIDGAWAGTLWHQSFQLRLMFYIASGPNGLIATMKSRDQNDAMVAMSAVTFIGSALILEAGAIGARFDGTLDVDLQRINGVWSQGGLELPLALERTGEDDLSRPQEPVEPYPYRISDAVVAGFPLRGTLTVPEGEGPFPAVLLIAGSGQLDRDESMHGHRPFLVLADHLTRHGVAVLRMDKRGVGESGGSFREATTADFAADAEAAVAYLAARPEIDRGRIGLIGHSEGGLIASMVAARTRDVAFVILLAAPGVSGWELAVQQARRSAEILGLNAEEYVRRQRDVVAVLRNAPDEAALRRGVETIFADLAEPQRSAVVKQLALPWQRHLIGLDPADYLTKVQCPVLAVNGEHDVTVEPKSNLEAIRNALASSGNRDFEILELPALNHLFQTCESSSGMEYGQIEETLAPAAMETIVEWIRLRTGLS
jgi:pimeloyl-ACP methyl ester carboxylesterase